MYGSLYNIGLIELKLYEGPTLLHHVKVEDRGTYRLRGGRLGVYCDSQEAIVWSALSYRLFTIFNNISLKHVLFKVLGMTRLIRR